MRSRPARLVLGALAWIALGSAAFLTFQQQQQIAERRAALRGFETSARDAVDALDDFQVSQQAYVAVGQDPREWTAKTATYLQTASTSIDAMRLTARSGAAGPALLDASTAVTQIANIERAVRQHLTAGDAAAAADAIFGEAADAVSRAVSNVDAAVESERQTADAVEADSRRLQAYALGGAAGAAAIVLAILGFAAPAGSSAATDAPAAAETANDNDGVPALPARDADRAPASAAPPQATAAAALQDETVRKLAGICTEFVRVRDAEQLKGLLDKAAALMDARGAIVWLGTTTGADLRPVLAYGYSDAALSRLASVPRSANNAAAAAYRSGAVQIVGAVAGGAQGAVVAPLLSADGCIGALTAELPHGREQQAATQALAQILAAQLAGVLAPAAAAAPEGAAEAHTAAG